MKKIGGHQGIKTGSGGSSGASKKQGVKKFRGVETSGVSKISGGSGVKKSGTQKFEKKRVLIIIIPM